MLMTNNEPFGGVTQLNEKYFHKLMSLLVACNSLTSKWLNEFEFLWLAHMLLAHKSRI